MLLRRMPRGITAIAEARPATCAASSLGQFNKSAQSNQQDLIGEMETNRQEKPARGEGVLLAANADQRKLFIEQRYEECLEGQGERIADGAVRGNKRAFFPLTVLRPVMRMVRALAGTLPVMRCITVSRGWAILAFAGVGMVRAAAHRKVNHQRRSDQDAAQPSHTTFCLPSNRHRRSSLTIFNQSHLPASSGVGGRVSSAIVTGTLHVSQTHLCCGPPLGGSLPWRLSDSRFPSSDVVAERRSRKASRYARLVWK
jgi:hypothetical protein